MEYCDFYKWFLVEELVLSFPTEFHYGKCSAIGRLSISPENSIFINNVKISSIDRKYQLNEGDLQLKVLWSVCGQVPVYNEPVEVYGEAVFCSKSHGERKIENILPKTVKDAKIECRHLDPKATVQYWSGIKEDYEPAVKVHSYRLVTQLDKLIDCNLRLRILDKLRE